MAHSGTHPLAIALIVAAGRGVRAGGGRPKQYRPIAGRALLARTVARFIGHPRVGAIAVVIAADDRALYEDALGPLLKDDKLLPWIGGGEARQDSVRAGLEALAAHAPDLVLIHDGVRPFVSDELIARLLDAAAASDVAGAVPALQLVDTVKRRGADGRIAETLDRAQMWRAQTPQAFKFEPILEAHRSARSRQFTDDAAVAEAAGLAVALVEGDARNIKVTTPQDFVDAERLIAGGNGAGAARTQVGFGFDVHRFEAGDHITLCGVRIPHTRALQGHSDADVALHALTDALLGAAAAGDIGQHFPPSDAKWRGAPSSLFVEHAVALVAERGGTIENVDLTLICEEPRIGPHRDVMRARVAELVGLPADRVNVKATTTERLGFTGRGEGIAAQAVATVKFG